MFTTFAGEQENVTDLMPETIVLGEDGVFHISEDAVAPDMKIDEDFKKLVDSVIK